MNRLMLTVATAALIPAFALAESHSNADMADDQTKAKPMEQAEGDAPMAEDGTQVAEDEEGMMPKADGTEMAEDADAMAPKADGTEMAEMGGTLGLSGSMALSEIEDGVIYTLSATDSVDWDETMTFGAVEDSWERIGSVEDVVIGSDGKIEGVIAEVGGFLGIGDKLVMLPLSDMKLVEVDEDEYAVITPFTTDQLTDMQTYEQAMMQ